MIYADKNTFAFNADYATNVAGDIDAIYYEPKAPTSRDAVTAQGAGVHDSEFCAGADVSGGGLYRGRGVPSPAEAITFWFAPDTETTRSDDLCVAAPGELERA